MPGHDDIFASLEIEAFVQDGKLTLHRQGVTMSYSGRYFTEISLPNLPVSLMARMTADGSAEVLIDGVSYQVTERTEVHRYGAILED